MATTSTAPLQAVAPVSPAAGAHSDRIYSVRALAALGVLFGHVFAIALAFQGIFDGFQNRLLLGGGVGACVLPLLPGRALRVLEWKPLALVGVASYSLYLLHVPLIETLTGVHTLVLEQERGIRVVAEPTDYMTLLLIAVPLSLGLAALSYRVIERPFVRLRRRWTQPSATAR